MILLAPMAGVTDAAFRHLCYAHGCDLAFCEMISANALFYDSEKTLALMQPARNEQKMAIQIFGGDPALLRDMAQKIAEKLGDNLALLDINFGCPAPKVVKCGYGSALMLNLQKASALIRAVVDGVSVPVTVKFRSGFDDQHINGVDFAQMAQDNGAAWVTVHGRTAKQMYSGKADWSLIEKVKRAVSIPVVGNGDVFSAVDVQRMKETTGCDHVMIARGAMGNPFIFAEAKALENGAQPPVATVKQKIETAKQHIALCCSYKEERQAVLQMRKHVAWYLSGIKGSAKIRMAVNAGETKEEILEILDTLAKSVIDMT